MKHEFLGQIYINESGKKKIKLLDADSIDRAVDKYEEGDRIVLKLETFYRKRSKDQNSALHWYFSKMADETGHSLDEIKEMMKMKFLKTPMTDANGNEVVDADSGEVEMVIRETKSLSTVEFMEFMDNVRAWSERVLGVELPPPDKNWKLNLK